MQSLQLEKAAYQARVESEIGNYRDVEQVHDLPASAHYINGVHLSALLKENFGYGGFEEMIVDAVRRHPGDEATLRILSLGSGNCDFETSLVLEHGLRCQFVCVELNEHMLARARASVEDKGIASQFSFVQQDINALEPPGRVDVAIANHSLHHFVELEHLFEVLHDAMTPDSVFLINDMIGRNGHMFWPATLDLVNRIWAFMPKAFKYNRQLDAYFPERRQFDCSVESFEGIRAQDILPQLDRVFQFKDFAPFYSLVTRFVDRDFGPNIDPEQPMHRAFLDFLWQLDDHCCREHLLRPTQMLAAVVRKDARIDRRRWVYFAEPRELYGLPDAALYAAFEPPARTPGPPYRWGDVLTFGTQGSSTPYQREGWRADDTRFSWTVGPRARLEIPVRQHAEPLQLLLKARPLLASDQRPSQRVYAWVNGRKVGGWSCNQASFTTYRVELSGELLRNADTLDLVLETPDAVSPAQAGISEDATPLGLAVVGLSVTR